METHWKFPYYPVSSDEMEMISDDRRGREIIKNKPPLGEGLTTRYVEIYLDKDGITYIVQDWERNGSGKVKSESYRSRDLK